MNTFTKVAISAGMVVSSAIATDRAAIGVGANILAPTGIIIQTRITPQIKMPVTLSYTSTSAIVDKDDETSNISNYTLGVAPQFIFAASEEMEAAAGLNLGLIASTLGGTFKDAPEDSDASFFIGPVLSVEYFFIKNFSLSGNFALTYTKQFEDKHDNDFGGSSLSTGSGVVFSWYFQ
ncbi:hypothetical protein OAA91_01580 [Fibrobacterales bacterium]|nr:hypothetical protein [Fibrobacterales bacterium]